MVFRRLFATRSDRRVPPAAERNHEGAPAYARTAHEALAQYAATGCLAGTFYASAEEQLDTVLALAREIAGTDPEFVAKTAIWAREDGRMKDAPALLTAFLLVDHGALAAAIFDRVIDDGRMLRKLVQVLRSGAVGRRSLGTRPKRLVRQWLAQCSDRDLFFASVGEQPSLGDIVKMVHPRPSSPQRSALLAWLCGRDVVASDLPPELRSYLAFLADPRAPLPDAPFLMLTGRPLGADGWRALARRATWQQTRQNLNTFLRHGALHDPEVAAIVAERLRDPEQITRARAFPYQLMAALSNLDASAPDIVRDALRDATELATHNVPAFDGRVLVAVDVSGSMHSPITGRRGSATSTVRCIDVAALLAATILRRNKGADVLPFHERTVPFAVPSRFTVAGLASSLAALPSGGTACSAPLVEWQRRRKRADLVILISDNESWIDAGHGGRGTATLAAWRAFRARNPGCRLVCLDLQPSRTTQTSTEDQVLNIGGFSDRVFDVIDRFGRVGHHGSAWIDAIRATVI